MSHGTDSLLWASICGKGDEGTELAGVEFGTNGVIVWKLLRSAKFKCWTATEEALSGNLKTKRSLS